MMTIVVRNDDGKTYAFNKGADLSILGRINDKEVVINARKEVYEISKKGYRTLCYSYKELPSKDSYTEEEVEYDLKLIGITGVEDALQDGVIECL
jgi:magnesium-transporting ATPase (P-type)